MKNYDFITYKKIPKLPNQIIKKDVAAVTPATHWTLRWFEESAASNSKQSNSKRCKATLSATTH